MRDIPTVTKEEFHELATNDPDMVHESPWIVNGLMETWSGYEAWGDLDALSSRFGHLNATAKSPQFSTHKDAPINGVRTQYSTYLDYIRDPHRVRELYPEPWDFGSLDGFLAQDRPLYSANIRIVTSASDPVLSEADPFLPPPLEVWNASIPYYYQLFNHFWLLVSLPGALTPLHCDNNGTIALIAQRQGEKKAVLYSPEDHRYVYNSEYGYLDPANPDEAQYPDWKLAERWEGTLSPGQILVIGTDWSHYVETLTPSISLSLDVVNDSNIHDYAQALDWAVSLGERIQKKPEIASRFSDRFKSLLSTSSASAIGREAMIEILRASMMRSRQDNNPTVVQARFLDELEAVVASSVEYAPRRSFATV